MRGIALILCAVATFAVQDTFAKYLAGAYPAVQVAWGRYAFSLFFICLALPWLNPRSAVISRKPLLQVLRGVLLYTSTLLFVLAVGYIPLATATAIGFVTPLLLTALSIPFLGEKVGPRRWIAIGIGFLGVLIIIRPSHEGHWHWALLLPVVMATFNAFYQVVTRQMRGIDRPVTALLYPTAVGAVVGFAPVPFVWVTPSLVDIGWMAAMGFCGAVSHMFLIRAFAQAPATTLAPFAYTQLLWVVVLGYVVFGDALEAATLVGAAIICASGLYIFYRERREKGR